MAPGGDQRISDGWGRHHVGRGLGAVGCVPTGIAGPALCAGAEQNKAKQLCAGCPVRTECLAEALDNQIEWGVWGGMTERERGPSFAAGRPPRGAPCSRPLASRRPRALAGLTAIRRGPPSSPLSQQLPHPAQAGEVVHVARQGRHDRGGDLGVCCANRSRSRASRSTSRVRSACRRSRPRRTGPSVRLASGRLPPSPRRRRGHRPGQGWRG